MTRPSSDKKLRLLVVEGRGDEYFFGKLLEHLGESESFDFVVCGGKQNLDEELTGILNRDDFARISHIGIVLDNDYQESRSGAIAFNTVIEAIDVANSNFTENNREISRQLTKPSGPRVKTDECPSISVLLLPADNRDGAVEDLVFDALPKDSILDCVDAYFACLSDTGIKPNTSRLPKSKLSVYLSGKVTDEDFARHDDAKRLFLTQAVDMKWWREEDMWNKPAFDDAKAFLSQLLAE